MAQPSNKRLVTEAGADAVFATPAAVTAAQSAAVTAAASASTAALATERATSNAAYALAGAVFDVRRYGAFSTVATGAANAATIQAANDAAAAAGGGRVLLPPGGPYPCVGVVQDSRVEIFGHGCTLKHPDGATGDMIRARVRTTTGSITAGSATLTVAAATGIEVGALVGVQGAGGVAPMQHTTLTTAINTTDTTLVLTDAAGFAASGLLQVESELVSYTGLTGSTLTGVTRGAYGTTAASHATSVYIGVALRLIAEVVAVSGTTVTLDRNAALGVTASAVSVGAVRPAITGLTLDGNRINGGSSSSLYAVNWGMVRYGRIDYSAVRAEAALYLADGARDCSGVIYARDCSVPEGGKGAAVWMFRGCQRNRIDVNLSGDMWVGMYLDNRTSTGTEWDGACDDNEGRLHITADPHSPFITNVGLLIMGGNRNRFTLTGKNMRTGLSLGNTDQVHAADGSVPTARGNVIDVRLSGIYQPWVLAAPGNTVSGYYEGVTTGTDSATNLIMAASAAPGANPTFGYAFSDGTQTAPGMGFASETNTGFYRITAGATQYVAQGALVARLRSTGILMADGKNLEIGTTTGTKIGEGVACKIGFFGATPTARPAAQADTSGATLAALETEVNALKAKLRTLGLMA